MAIPVNGDPRDFLFPIPVPELPASSYREEDAIVDDIQRTSGISDPVTGGDVGASETATGVQLVQQAAGDAHPEQGAAAGELRSSSRRATSSSP